MLRHRVDLFKTWQSSNVIMTICNSSCEYVPSWQEFPKCWSLVFINPDLYRNKYGCLHSLMMKPWLLYQDIMVGNFRSNPRFHHTYVGRNLGLTLKIPAPWNRPRTHLVDFHDCHFTVISHFTRCEILVVELIIVGWSGSKHRGKPRYFSFSDLHADDFPLWERVV